MIDEEIDFMKTILFLSLLRKTFIGVQESSFSSKVDLQGILIIHELYVTDKIG